ELRLTPTSKTFKEWKDPSSPLVLDFYFFNWTNPEEIYNVDFKPKLSEVGPYSFKEYFDKVNVTWNKNNTISFKRRRVWYFDPEKSKGTLDDVITTLNPVALSAAYTMRHNSYYMKLSLELTNGFTRQEITVSRTVEEFLYTGYSNELLTLAMKLPQTSNRKLPGDKFAWFYQRNGSSEYEGTFNMGTGAEDISVLGRLREWNYKNKTDFYSDQCGMINGSDGAFYSPGQVRSEPLELYSAEFCKTLKFEYLEDTDLDGILGFRYIGGKLLLDSGELDPDNWCNCNGECVPPGVFNISSCRYGAPAFVSYPHFLYADCSYLQQVEGLQPNESRHRSHIVIEPKTGIPMDVAVRFQINLLLQPHEFVSIYRDAPRIFFPMIWFEETFRLSSENSNNLKELVLLPQKGLYFSIGLTGLGLALVAIAMFKRFTRDSDGRRFQSQKSVELTET
ncbi:hypothetical protein L9F63_005297, partial [Diploptera punctata]